MSMRVLATTLVAIVFSLSFTGFSFAQTNLNMTLQDSMDYPVGVNDVSGYHAADGKEYALVGLNTGVSIVDINEDVIKEVVFVPGVDNTWRDINCYGHYAYVCSEARVGLLIIDLQYLPDSVKTYVWSDTIPTPSGDKPFEKAHTLFIDEHGILYLNGSNLNSGGVVMVDIKSNPTDPQFLGLAPAIYSHDCYARDSIIYSAEIYSGDLSIYDAHDPSDIKLIGRVKTPNEFTHNAWLSDDSRYMFTTDERANSYVTSYDIQDPGNIIELDRFRQAATNGNGSIPHNVYVWNDWIVVAYYTNGTLILDAARPDNLIEVGSFDSFLGNEVGFSGVWGSDPFLPSGKIIASDRNNGLFVFIPNYVRAAYLEGVVIDSVTKIPIPGATVRIISDEIVLPQITKLDGTFKTGKAVPGTFDIVVKKEGYYQKTIVAQFINGELLTPTIELTALPKYTYGGRVLDSKNRPVFGATVALQGPEGYFETTTDANGDFFLPEVYEGTYDIQAGIWGETVETSINLLQSESVVLQLEAGYKDDFDIDLGWTVTGNATEGEWTRGIPTQQLLFDNWLCGSGTDSPNDLGSSTYSTGLATHNQAQNDEVSGGLTILASPLMDLDTVLLPKLSFDYWLCEFPPNQIHGFKVYVSNGIDTSVVAEFSNNETNGSWQTFTTNLSIDGPRDQVQVLFVAEDSTQGSGDYYLKVHVDNFKLLEGSVSTGDEWSYGKNFLIYPNPVSQQEIYLRPLNGIEGNTLSIQFHDIQGRTVSSVETTRQLAEQGIRHGLKEGVYFMHWSTEHGERGVEKIFVVTR